MRVLDVLTAAGDGIVLQDRPDSLTVWIDAQFKDLPPQIRQALQVWIDVLREGTRGGGLVLGAPPSPGWPASARSWPRSPSTTALCGRSPATT